METPETITPPPEPMGTVFLRSFFVFVAGYLGAFALALLIFHLGRRDPASSRETDPGEIAWWAYLLFVMGAPPAGAFAIVTSPWAAWTRARRTRVAWLSIAAGFATYAAQLTGAVNLLALIPLPAGFGWLAAALRVLLPGVATGLAAVAIAHFTSPAGKTGFSMGLPPR